MKRKFIKFILQGLCILLVTGCTSSKQIEQEHMYFLFATPLREHPIWLQAKKGFDDACKAYDANCDWLGYGTIDTSKMNEVIETGILQSADGIITQGVVSEELLAKAYEKDIPVVLVDSDMPDSMRFAYMGKDFHEQAVILLEDIQERLGKDVYLKIAIQVAELSFKIAKDQIAEINDVFRTHPGGFEIVNISESKSDKVRSKQEWKNVLNNHKDSNIAINFAAESAQFCFETAKELHIQNEMLIYAVDDMEDTLDLIRNGSITGSVVVDSFYDYGYEAVKLLYEYKTKHRIPKTKVVNPELLIVDDTNVDTYRKRKNR